MQFIYFKHSTYIACVVGAKGGRGRGKGEKSEREKGREDRLLPLSPIALLFSLPPYPLPLSPTYTESGTFEWSRFFPKQVHHINVQDFHPAKRLNSISSETNSCQNQKHKK